MGSRICQKKKHTKQCTGNNGWQLCSGCGDYYCDECWIVRCTHLNRAVEATWLCFECYQFNMPKKTEMKEIKIGQKVYKLPKTMFMM